MDSTSLQVGVVHWGKIETDDGISRLISSTLAELGCRPVDFVHDQRLPENLHAVLACGPLDSLVPMANQLLAHPPSHRPLLVLWMTEQFPNPDLPEPVRRLGGLIRSEIERIAYRRREDGGWEVHPCLEWLTTKAHRFRYYGDLYWLQRAGLLSVLSVASPWTAAALHASGFDPLIAHLGFHPSWGRDLGLERDIPVLWIGKVGTARRRNLLERIREDLRERDIQMVSVDGVEHPYVFGEERTILLNRTKIALNLLREEWDDNSMRYCLAAPNRALIVTEPTLKHTPLRPGVHLVEAPIDRMVDTICYYLEREEERQRIVDQAYQLVTTELTMRQGLAQILERIALLRSNGFTHE